jgi:hypothetical protein
MPIYCRPSINIKKSAFNILHAQSGGFAASSFSQCSIGDAAEAGCDSPDPDLVFAICTTDHVDAETANAASLTIKPSDSNCQDFNFDLSNCEVFPNPPGEVCSPGEIFIYCHIASLEDVICSDEIQNCGSVVYGLTADNRFIPCEQTSK